MPTESPRDSEDQLKKALEECASLKEENARLKKLLEFIGYPSKNIIPVEKPQRDPLISGRPGSSSVRTNLQAKTKWLFSGVSSGAGRTSIQSAGKERMEDPAIFRRAGMSGTGSSAVNRKLNVLTAKTEVYCLLQMQSSLTT